MPFVQRLLPRSPLPIETPTRAFAFAALMNRERSKPDAVGVGSLFVARAAANIRDHDAKGASPGAVGWDRGAVSGIQTHWPVLNEDRIWRTRCTRREPVTGLATLVFRGVLCPEDLLCHRNVHD